MTMSYFHAPLFLVLLVLTTSADPDPLWDFCVADNNSTTVFINGLPCINTTDAFAEHFTTSVLRTQGSTNNSDGASVTAASNEVIPGINTLGIMMARVDLAVGGRLRPHSHPRASEICFVLQGSLRVGFYDTTNKLFNTDIQTGDVFVFPKALVHYIQNNGNITASAIMAYNSQSPGGVIPYSPLTEIGGCN